MITKKMYCENIVNKWCKDNDTTPQKACKDIYNSSNLAVALEYLGLLRPEEIKYSSSRAGIVEVYQDFDENGKYKNSYFLSVRDMISLLPETLDKEEN